jgi:6-phosphogluconolactonase
MACSTALTAAVGMSASPAPGGGGASLVYFGTYTGPKSQGVYVSSFDAATGKLGAPRLAAETENPSFLALHPTRPLLYAANEVDNFEGGRAGSVSAFAIDPATGDLRALGRASSRGAHPCHLAVDRGGRHVLVANYSGGSVASLPLRADGGLEPASSFVQHTGASVDAKRQKGPHAHMIETDPSNAFALAADLGLDQVLVYRFDAGSGRLAAADPPHARVAPGSGPRHFAFSPDGRDLYVLNEMLVTVTAFKHDRGRLTETQTVSAMPSGTPVTPADSGAEIAVHPGGRFVYASLRGPDSLAVFARDAQTGRLTLVEHVPSGGKTPRSFGIDPSGRWLLAAHQRSDQVAVFGIHAATGRLTPTGQVIEVGAPVSVSFFAPPAVGKSAPPRPR